MYFARIVFPKSKLRTSWFHASCQAATPDYSSTYLQCRFAFLAQPISLMPRQAARSFDPTCKRWQEWGRREWGTLWRFLCPFSVPFRCHQVPRLRDRARKGIGKFGSPVRDRRSDKIQLSTHRWSRGAVSKLSPCQRQRTTGSQRSVESGSG